VTVIHEVQSLLVLFCGLMCCLWCLNVWQLINAGITSGAKGALDLYRRQSVSSPEDVAGADVESPVNICLCILLSVVSVVIIFIVFFSVRNLNSLCYVFLPHPCHHWLCDKENSRWRELLHVVGIRETGWPRLCWCAVRQMLDCESARKRSKPSQESPVSSLSNLQSPSWHNNLHLHMHQFLHNYVTLQSVQIIC